MPAFGRTLASEFSKKLSNSATKRLPLTTKKAGKGFYKGKGGTKEGRHTSKGRYIIDPKKRVELIVPDLAGFKVRDVSDACVVSEAVRDCFMSRSKRRCLVFVQNILSNGRAISIFAGFLLSIPFVFCRS
mmetsp:Transcript_4065/g.7819  ORF Transcript_4065/g.7819 Transcript_4065/m.7819 type:complete len:130 (-) Transcript_4065:162-551(-)